VTLIAIKVLLAPGFVVLASLLGRRFGPRLGGLIGGLPVVAGPILLVYALEHGKRFAAHSATGTLLGMVSLMAYVVVYGRLARRGAWWRSLLAGWCAFALFTLLFTPLRVPAAVALAIVAVALVAAPLLLPRAVAGLAARTPLPSWDLPLRAVCTLVLVLSLTAAAGWLGPQLSGLLTPFPVIATVLACFSHAQYGPDDVLQLLRGLLMGYGGFALFCFVVAVATVPFGIAAAFLLACLAAVLCQFALLLRMRSLAVSAAPAAGP
jgi:hypothetical protein